MQNLARSPFWQPTANQKMSQNVHRTCEYIVLLMMYSLRSKRSRTVSLSEFSSRTNAKKLFRTVRFRSACMGTLATHANDVKFP